VRDAEKHGAMEPAQWTERPGSVIGALQATPAECTLITASPAGIDAAHDIGAHAIGYARTPDDREHLADAGATCTIPSLADLTLRLRARPLPNWALLDQGGSAARRRTASPAAGLWP